VADPERSRRYGKKAMHETAAAIMSDIKTQAKTKTHKMTLYNLDLDVDWQTENDRVKIVAVRIINNHNPDLLNFLSGKVFKMIVKHINDNKDATK
jgi:hypothetical protein